MESAVSGAAQPLCLIPAQIDAATIISLRSTLSGRFRYILFQLLSIATKFATKYLLFNFSHISSWFIFVSLQVVPTLSSRVAFNYVHVTIHCITYYSMFLDAFAFIYIILSLQIYRFAYCLVWQDCSAQLQCRWG